MPSFRKSTLEIGGEIRAFGRNVDRRAGGRLFGDPAIQFRQAGHTHIVHHDGPAFLTSPIAVLLRQAIPETRQSPANPEVREVDFYPL